MEPRGATELDDLVQTTSLVTEKESINENANEEPPRSLPTSNEDVYPDGGWRAWLVVVGTMCSTFSTLGYATSWGVFQAYYEQTLLRDSSPSNIAWIGSIQFALIFLPGIFTGRMFDLGYFKLPFFIASLVMVLATFLVAECTEYWHFLLCQGLATGLAGGITFLPSMSVIAHWFHKRRGLATGFLAIGSAIGGTTLPIATRQLIPIVGFKWTMRILGFILLATFGVANLTLRRRLPPKKLQGGIFNLALFKTMSYTSYCISAFFAFLGTFSLIVYIDISAASVGVDPNFAFYLVSIANGTSLFGRLFAGIFVDKIGGVNTMAPMSLVIAAVTYAWPFAQSKGPFIAIAMVYGFAYGVYVSSFMLPLFAMGDVRDVGRRNGMAAAFIAAGAICGPPISGAINKATGGFKAVGFYAGSTVLVSVGFMLITRHLILRKVWGKF